MAAQVGLRLAGRFLGNAVSEAFAFAAGVAIGPVLGPPTQALRNAANATYPNVPIGPGVLAEGVAQGQIPHDTAQEMATHSGISHSNFDHMVEIANVGPGSGYAFDFWRRGIIDETGFRRAVQRLGIEQEWIDDLVQLKAELLAPADLARAIHRGLIPDPNLLQGRLPAREGNVPAYPVYNIDALKEALGSGIDHDRLGVLVGLQGLPMGSHEAAQALFRGVLTEDDYLRAISEGNTRNEWADAIMAQSRQIPSSSNYVAAFIRGWIDRLAMHAGAARHGMTADDADLLALISGRPVTTRQAFIGFIRGGRVDGQAWDERETFRRAVIQSNIRPEWEPILWAQRYSYPSAFVLRALVQSGDITQAEGLQALLYSGWEPTFAQKVATAWAGGATGAAVNPNVKKGQGQLWTATHRSYIAGTVERAQADTALAKLEPDAVTRNAIFVLWDAERDVTVKSLTPAQVKSAYTNSVITLDAALAELARLGYDAEASARLLGTVSQAPTISQIMAEVESSVRAGTVDTTEAIAQLRAAGMTTQNATALVATWQGNPPAA